MKFLASLTSVSVALLAGGLCSAQNLRAPSEVITHRHLQDGGSIADIVKREEDFSTLETALEITSLDRVFECYFTCFFRHFTVFAPTNEAFGNLPDGILEKLVTPAYRVHLTYILAYHVLSQTVAAADIINAGSTVTAKTLLGETLNATFESPDVLVNDNAKVVRPDIQADNGIIHGIDAVLLPEFATKTIADLAVGEPNLSTLVEALVNASLVDTFSNSTATFTVFAPTNEAFQDLFTALGGAPDLDTLTRVLSYHVVPDVLLSPEIRPNSNVETLVDGETIEFEKRGFGRRRIVLNGDTKILSADNLAINGVVHVIDKVLLPSDLRPESSEPDVVDVVLKNENIFSSLIAALGKADLVSALREQDSITVFAPTNTAFDKTFKALNITSLDQIETNTLRDILLYHVVPTKAFFRDLVDNSDLPTLLSPDATIRVTLRRFWWRVIGADLNGDTHIIGANAEASNGVIHAIDKVLIPPS